MKMLGRILRAIESDYYRQKPCVVLWIEGMDSLHVRVCGTVY